MMNTIIVFIKDNVNNWNILFKKIKWVFISFCFEQNDYVFFGLRNLFCSTSLLA